MNFEKKLAISLFSMRITVFIVMLMWTVDKLVRPEHASTVYETFYGLSGIMGHMMQAVGVLELILILGFLLGLFKSITYLLVLIFHTISAFSTIGAYFTPFTGNHLLFFAALPMWAACLSLYLLRDKDTLLSLSKNIHPY
ncbi:hypothetical protein [Legionella israelensis]|uniref:DoxX family protein n=1 Tax=Legionella israelensis TaxID=454 RepID=A0A0W0VSQ2_9GAMM|nr:hypothetical protein [Legionella israelensis]KTD23082.1 hypothetical protein Lisr_1450 [Legionella israelensis]QBS10296.1 hypothetical protein E4T55_10755 [Legionella israelensis]SCY46510.1 hypothetical protein SAMN02746069_02551 [Legionella israelensis DSM 19235]STX59895.1 Uncharacterised protein [Legionella israelensis]